MHLFLRRLKITIKNCLKILVHYIVTQKFTKKTFSVKNIRTINIYKSASIRFFQPMDSNILTGPCKFVLY